MCQALGWIMNLKDTEKQKIDNNKMLLLHIKPAAFSEQYKILEKGTGKDSYSR